MKGGPIADREKELERRLALALRYLKLLDLPAHANGFDLTPEGWDIPVRELIRRLEADD